MPPGSHRPRLAHSFAAQRLLVPVTALTATAKCHGLPASSSREPVRNVRGAEALQPALQPRQRRELAAVARQGAGDGVAAEEQRRTTVLLHVRDALDDDAAQHPGLAVHREIAL